MPTPNGALMANGVNPHATPLQTPLQSLTRPPMATPGAPTGPPGSAPPSAAPSRPTPKPKAKSAGSNLPAPPLDDVHAAFVEFRAKEEDKVRMLFLKIKPGEGEQADMMEYSACLCNASTANKCAPRTPVASASTCLSALHTSV